MARHALPLPLKPAVIHHGGGPLQLTVAYFSITSANMSLNHATNLSAAQSSGLITTLTAIGKACEHIKVHKVRRANPPRLIVDF